MDAHNRLFRRSLRDVLVDQGVLTADQADELVESAFETNEPFGQVVVDAGYLSSWDLMKLVSSKYQLPVMPLAGYQLESDVLKAIAPSVLYQHQIVPVGKFGKSWTFAVVEPPSHACLETLRAACGSSLFFFVSDAADVQRTLAQNVKVVDAQADDSWQSIFDSGDERVLADIDTTGPSDAEGVDVKEPEDAPAAQDA